MSCRNENWNPPPSAFSSIRNKKKNSGSVAASICSPAIWLLDFLSGAGSDGSKRYRTSKKVAEPPIVKSQLGVEFFDLRNELPIGRGGSSILLPEFLSRRISSRATNNNDHLVAASNLDSCRESMLRKRMCLSFFLVLEVLGLMLTLQVGDPFNYSACIKRAVEYEKEAYFSHHAPSSGGGGGGEVFFPETEAELYNHYLTRVVGSPSFFFLLAVLAANLTYCSLFAGPFVASGYIPINGPLKADPFTKMATKSDRVNCFPLPPTTTSSSCNLGGLSNETPAAAAAVENPPPFPDIQGGKESGMEGDNGEGEKLLLVEVDDEDDDEAPSPFWVYREKRKHCSICDFMIPLRGKHCHDCGRCVERQDHHCFWLGTCVGRHNQVMFFSLLVSMLAAITQGWRRVGPIFWYCSTYCGQTPDSSWLRTVVYECKLVAAVYGICLGCICFNVMLLITHLHLISSNQTTYEFVKGAESLPYLSHWNRSPNLRYGHHSSGRKWGSHLPAAARSGVSRIAAPLKEGNPFSHGVLRNWWLFLNQCSVLEEIHGGPRQLPRWYRKVSEIFSGPSRAGSHNTAAEIRSFL